MNAQQIPKFDAPGLWRHQRRDRAEAGWAEAFHHSSPREASFVFAVLGKIRYTRRPMEPVRTRQRTFPFGREHYASVWRSIPERERKEVTTLWARLIAAAARTRRGGKGAKP